MGVREDTGCAYAMPLSWRAIRACSRVTIGVVLDTSTFVSQYSRISRVRCLRVSQSRGRRSSESKSNDNLGSVHLEDKLK